MPEMILNIETSLSKKKWVGNSIDIDRRAEFLMQRNNVSLLTATTLAHRKVDPDDVTAYLDPKIKNLMPDPCLLTDMRKATNRVLSAVANQEKITIYADFDVDGTSSAALLILWFKHHGIEPSLYIPNRIEEGYGPNLTAFKQLAKKPILDTTS